MWAVHKDILGFTFYGIKNTVCIGGPKRYANLKVMKGWVCASESGSSGIPFAELCSVIAKMRHAFILIPSRKGLMSPYNAIIWKEPKFVFLHRNEHLLTALMDFHTLLRKSTLTPTKCTELVSGWPDLVGVKDASVQGVVGVIIGDNEAFTPMFLQM